MKDKRCFLAEGDDLRTESNCAKGFSALRKKNKAANYIWIPEGFVYTPLPNWGVLGLHAHVYVSNIILFYHPFLTKSGAAGPFDKPEPSKAKPSLRLSGKDCMATNSAVITRFVRVVLVSHRHVQYIDCKCKL